MVEIRFIEDYPLNRIDEGDNFYYQFWPGSFTLKNIPTPNFEIPDLPPIKVSFTNGTGSDLKPYCSYEDPKGPANPVLFETEFTGYVPTPDTVDIDFKISD